MPILRDSVTGQGVFSGTAVECVRLARDLGEDTVIYDSVPDDFDPDAVLAENDAQVNGLRDVADTSDDEDQRDTATTIVEELTAPVPLEEVQAAIESAHEHHEQLHG